jgi:hypothetical protein
MPEYICDDCGYKGRDAFDMKKHLNRKYPCNSVSIASKEKIEVVKKDELNIEPKPVKEIKYKMKIDIEDPKNNKLEKI